jgi:hypothetical protein
MPAAVRLREDFSAEELRALAKRSKDVHQSRRLLSLAAVRDGMERGEAAKIGGMDRHVVCPVTVAVPELSTWALLLVGFAGLGLAFRIRTQAGSRA